MAREANLTKKEPLVRAVRRLDITKKQTWVVKIIGILIAFLICALVSTICKPGTFFDFFGKLASGTFGSPNRFVNFLEEMGLLLIISIALTPAFKMKFWNIGAEGQVLAGACACFMVMKFIGANVPTFLLWILMIVCSLGAGILWSVIPAIFKAFFNTNETLFTLMMNYIAKGLIVFFISVWPSNGSGVMEPVVNVGNLPKIGGFDYIINIIIVAIVTALVFVYLKYTKHGYEISIVGGSPNTARYIGINVKKVIIRTMFFTGAICGLTGFLITAGATHTITSEVVAGRGFTAVLVCWVSGLNPLEMILNSALITFLQSGSNEACSYYFTNGSNYADIMVGVFFFTLIAVTFFTRYKLVFPRHEANKLAAANELVLEHANSVNEAEMSVLPEGDLKSEETPKARKILKKPIVGKKKEKEDK